MKEISASLDICTSSLSLIELSSRLGYQPSPTSHSKGDRRPSLRHDDKAWRQTIWRIDSKASKASPLLEHLSSLVEQIPPAALRSGVLPSDCEVWINVAVYFDTASLSVQISTQEMRIVGDYAACLEINCYPATLSDRGQN